jgi:hypothetical protein
LRLHPDVHPVNGVLHGGEEVTRPEVELVTDATLDTVVVDDLFGIRPVTPTSRCPNADVGISRPAAMECHHHSRCQQASYLMR